MNTPPRPTSANSRRWVVFFAMLAALGVAAVVIPIVVNLKLQLTAEQVDQAEQRWRAAGPGDYDLRYQVRTSHEGRTVDDDYVVEVRGGRVRFVGCNGELLYADPAVGLVAGPGIRAAHQADGNNFGVEAMFRMMKEALGKEKESARRNYLTATFDPRDGHPLHYVRRVRGTGERQEWTITLTRVGDSSR